MPIWQGRGRDAYEKEMDDVGILGVLAVGSFTVYASEQAVSESETERNITSQEVEATTEMETEAEPVICTEATAVDFVEATTEGMAGEESPDGEITPEMQICREFLGNYLP